MWLFWWIGLNIRTPKNHGISAVKLHLIYSFPLLVAQQPHSGPGRPHYRGFTFIHRHTTVGSTPLDEWSARRRDLYLATHNSHKRQTSMPPPPSGRIRPHDPSKRAGADPCLRPRGHWDRLFALYFLKITSLNLSPGYAVHFCNHDGKLTF
jgi:hypothetical protein